jgi:hypothetical protein
MNRMEMGIKGWRSGGGGLDEIRTARLGLRCVVVAM